MAWYEKGLDFSCTRCSSCCRHVPGYVYLSESDIAVFMQAFRVTRREFLFKYTKQVDFGIAKRISLIEKNNHDCIFWDNGCVVYESRPLQCRSFPFWHSVLSSSEVWDETAQNCPGMNAGTIHSFRTIERWLRERESEPYVEE